MRPRQANPVAAAESHRNGFVAEVAAYLDEMTPEERARLEEAERLDRAHVSSPEREPDDAL